MNKSISQKSSEYMIDNVSKLFSDKGNPTFAQVHRDTGLNRTTLRSLSMATDRKTYIKSMRFETVAKLSDYYESVYLKSRVTAYKQASKSNKQKRELSNAMREV